MTQYFFFQLNKDQKQEMQSLRAAASNLTNKRKTSSLSRVTYVQAILESIQVIHKSQKAIDVSLLHIQLFTVFLCFLPLI